MGYSSRRGDGPPAWFLFIIAIALVFGGYYLLTNFRQYMAAGGLSIAEATRVSLQQATATEMRLAGIAMDLPTPRPTNTPRPACELFEVSANSGIMRQQPTTAAPLVATLTQGTEVCVLGREQGGDGFTWYLIDRDPVTQRIETGYMREDILRPINPTPTPSDTALPAPTITSTATPTATTTSETLPTRTPAADATDRPSVTPQPTDTPVSVNI